MSLAIRTFTSKHSIGTLSFQKCLKQGGFDVVVGNPPYIRQEWLAPYKSHWEQEFESYHGVADIYAYFFERGLEVLREGGQLAFITSGSWVRGNFGAPLRETSLRKCSFRIDRRFW